MKTSILGREYELREATPETDPLLNDTDGYCDSSIALCVIDAQNCRSVDTVKDLERYKRKVTRHELIHAFLAESGLCEQCDWACEEMVDWLAYQFPKMAAVFQSAGCSD